MVKRFLAAAVLLVAIGCGDAAPPTSSKPAAGSPFGGVAAMPRANVHIGPEVPPVVETVDPATLTVTGLVTFDEFGPTNTNHDGIVDVEGASLAERFAGQTLSISEDFDVLSGTPSNPLTLQVGAPNQNLNTLFDSPSNATVIDGQGPGSALGEGAIAIKFHQDQSELGFSIVGADAGTATVNFFRRDGSLIETVVLQLANLATAQAFAFRRSGSTRDIAGLSIHNDDPGGIGYDDLRMAESQSSSERIEANDPNTNTVVVEEDGNGDGTSSPVVGVEIPPRTFTQDVDVTVRVVEVTPAEPCHDFLLGQIGKCVEITATNVVGGGKATLNNDVIVGVCLPAHLHLEMYKFESRLGRALPLKQVAAAFLNCSDLEVAAAKPGNWLEGLAMGVSKRVGRWLTPESLWAADRGFGGTVHKDDGFSFFTWASPIQVANAGLAINLFNSGKDAFGIDGTFDLQPKDFAPFLNEAGFDPAAHAVTVAYGDYVETIPLAKFVWSNRFKRYAFSSSASVGVNYMDIDPQTGAFRLAGRAPTEGDALPTYRPFTVQIGHRVKGGGLFCGSDNRCGLEH